MLQWQLQNCTVLSANNISSIICTSFREREREVNVVISLAHTCVWVYAQLKVTDDDAVMKWTVMQWKLILVRVHLHNWGVSHYCVYNVYIRSGSYFVTCKLFDNYCQTLFVNQLINILKPKAFSLMNGLCFACLYVHF